MTSEAGLGRWHSGMRHTFDRAVTEDACNTDTGDMEIVPERNGLVCAVADVPEPVRSHINEATCENGQQSHAGSNDSQSEGSVGFRPEELRHRTITDLAEALGWRVANSSRNAPAHRSPFEAETNRGLSRSGGRREGIVPTEIILCRLKRISIGHSYQAAKQIEAVDGA